MSESELMANLTKWILVLGGTFLFLATVVLYSSTKARAEEQAREAVAWQLIAEGALLVDVRTPKEFEAGHLEGAINISHEQTADRLAEYGDDKNRTIVVYCRSGRRSGVAEDILKENGYTNVHNGGGYEALLAAKPDDGA